MDKYLHSVPNFLYGFDLFVTFISDIILLDRVIWYKGIFSCLALSIEQTIKSHKEFINVGPVENSSKRITFLCTEG